MSGRSCDYSPGEERLNVLTHAAGAVLALGGMALVPFVVPEHGVRRVAAFAVYLLALFGMYLASSCYHAARTPERKALLLRFDHAAIYLLIAGTYTPVMLLAVGGSLGIAILAAVWMIGLAGIVIKCFSRHRFGRWSLILYLAMGWLGIIAVRQMFAGMGALSFGLLLAGGVVYSLGAFFYASGRPYCHAAWHLFVLGGSTLHYFAVLLLP